MSYTTHLYSVTTIRSKFDIGLRFLCQNPCCYRPQQKSGNILRRIIGSTHQNSNRAHNFLVTTKYIVLPPPYETIVLVKAHQPIRINCIELIEPLPHRVKAKFWVARHVTLLRTPHTYCRVYNPHNNPVWIRRYTPIATVELLNMNLLSTFLLLLPHTNPQNTLDLPRV